jgi:mRNA-degrading endonuclease toxin of MazEF toxin-antitoxin module
MTLSITRITKKIGEAKEDVMLQVTRALAVFLGIG